MTLRPDLVAAHDLAWASFSRAGTWWSARQRHELAGTAIDAMWGRETEPAEDRAVHAPVGAHRAVARMASGSPAVTRQWYEGVRDELGALEYVELVGLVATAAAAASLRHSLGLPEHVLAEATDEEATRVPPPELANARLNWVPVAAPADGTAAVVQALSAVPAAFDDLWRLADAQYIPDAEMVDLRWTRGTLSRVEIELVATKVSFSRECHY